MSPERLPQFRRQTTTLVIFKCPSWVASRRLYIESERQFSR
jgi:hypothetical protein